MTVIDIPFNNQKMEEFVLGWSSSIDRGEQQLAACFCLERNKGQRCKKPEMHPTDKQIPLVPEHGVSVESNFLMTCIQCQRVKFGKKFENQFVAFFMLL